MSKAAVLWLKAGFAGCISALAARSSTARKPLGAKDKTPRRAGAMIGLDAAVAIRNGWTKGAGGKPLAGKDRKGASPMQDIVELERRITAAMERIGAGLDRRASSEGGKGDGDEIARLTEALDEERMANAQLNERVRVLHERATSGAGEADEGLQAQLAAQADEISTLRRVLAEAGKEIASLRAARAAEAAELAEVVAALDPLVKDAEHA